MSYERLTSVSAYFARHLVPEWPRVALINLLRWSRLVGTVPAASSHPSQ